MARPGGCPRCGCVAVDVVDGRCGHCRDWSGASDLDGFDDGLVVCDCEVMLSMYWRMPTVGPVPVWVVFPVTAASNPLLDAERYRDVGAVGWKVACPDCGFVVAAADGVLS